MKPSSMSLFEREMRDQVAAARAAVVEAERRGDPLLTQAATSHLDGLLDLARRNGVPLGAETPSVDVPGTDPAGTDPAGPGPVDPEPVVA